MKSSTMGFCRQILVVLIATLSFAAGAVSDAQVLLLETGTHKLIRESENVARVAVGNPAIADVSVINQRELLITGKAEGITSLLVWPKRGAAMEYRVKVGRAGPHREQDARSGSGAGQHQAGAGLAGPTAESDGAPARAPAGRRRGAR